MASGNGCFFKGIIRPDATPCDAYRPLQNEVETACHDDTDRTPLRCRRLLRRVAGIFRTSYRASWWADGKLVSIYGDNKSTLVRHVRKFSSAVRYTIYKTGPFYIPERPVDWSD